MEKPERQVCFQVVSEEIAREHLGDEFEARVEESRKREDKIRRFEAEMAREGGLGERFLENPVGTAREYGILGPQDRLELAFGEPQLPDFPGLEDFPRPRCFWVCHWHWQWICVRVGRFSLCYRRLVFHCRLRCIWV